MLAKQQQRVLAGSMIAGATLLLTVLLSLSLALSLTKPLARTIAAVRSIRSGNYRVHMDVTASGEIGELQTSIKEMADSLNQLTSDLENKVLSRTRELEDARNEAVKSNADKMRLIQQLNSAVEEARKTISREIHDHLNAKLVAARLEAQRILTLTENNFSNDFIEEINKRARAIIALTSNLYKIAREIVRKLRPEIIDALGLCGAVEEMIRHYDALHPGYRFSFEHKGDFSSLSDDLSIAVYRLIQEALSNIVKHSGATTALVTLHCLVENHRLLKLSVSDDGMGFDVKTTEPGIGLIGMRERVLGLGGQLTIRTAPGTGTTITIEVPLLCPDQP